ncbi:hypothetical protein GCM10009663_09940 [Kitasatospora arboriphila]|uniref:Uncharacterized protein n=1 Tax=Kitasatospora arboriphila TaxID=258052 RepID=A0ABP4DX80_9ACTN
MHQHGPALAQSRGHDEVGPHGGGGLGQGPPRDCAKTRLPLLPFMVVDRNVYTGQNPASSGRLAERLVADLDPAAQR